VTIGSTGCFVDFCRTLFLYWRGGYRFALNGQTGFEANVDTIYDGKNTELNVPIIYQFMSTQSPAALVWGASHTQVYPDMGFTPLDVTLPYSSIMKCQLNQNWVTTNERQNTGRMTVRIAPNQLTMSSAANTNFLLTTGGGDDFILGWQLPSPLMKINTEMGSRQQHNLPREGSWWAEQRPLSREDGRGLKTTFEPVNYEPHPDVYGFGKH